MHVDSPKVIVELAERRGVFVTGYHANQSTLAPKGYLTGAEWNWGKVYTDYVSWVQAGKTYPHLLRGGLKDGFVKVSPYGKAVSRPPRRRPTPPRRSSWTARWSSTRARSRTTPARW
jgi:simple sugar transport system substrate-binding protein